MGARRTSGRRWAGGLRAIALGAGLGLGIGLASGCVSLGRQYEGVALPTEKLTGLRVGVTTRAEVLERFGAPTIVERRGLEGLLSGLGSRFRGAELTVKLDPALFNDVYIYEYRRVNRKAIVLGFFNYISSDEKSDRLAIFFDAEGRVAGYGLTEGTKEL